METGRLLTNEWKMLAKTWMIWGMASGWAVGMVRGACVDAVGYEIQCLKRPQGNTCVRDRVGIGVSKLGRCVKVGEGVWLGIGVSKLGLGCG